MISNEANSRELRSFPRCPADESSAVMLSSANVISYSVLNISKAGLAFCYYGSIETSLVKPITTVTLLSNDFGATELPVEVISDTEVTKKNVQLDQIEVNPKGPYLRQCCLKFLPMSDQQEKTVDEYLHNCCLIREM